MSDIILKDADGQNVTYTGVEQISAPTTDGGVAVYTEGGGSGGGSLYMHSIYIFASHNVFGESCETTIVFNLLTRSNNKITTGQELFGWLKEKFTEANPPDGNNYYKMRLPVSGTIVYDATKSGKLDILAPSRMEWSWNSNSDRTWVAVYCPYNSTPNDVYPNQTVLEFEADNFVAIQDVYYEV